jgi:signal transduction histidine kinase
MEYLAGLALGWLTLAVGLLAYRWVRRQSQEWRYGTPVDHSALLVTYGRKMTATADQQVLADILLAELPPLFQARRAALLLPRAHQLVDAGGGDLVLPVSHAAVRWVASAGEAQRGNERHLRKLIEQGRADLSWVQAWVPLMRGIDLRGLWLLGSRQGHKLFAVQDLHCLTALGRQAAMVLETTEYAEQERRTASEMRALYQQVVTAREEERGRLARELHDGVLQDLCAVTRDLKAQESLNGETGLPTAAPPTGDLASRAGDLVQSLRAICNDLRPPLLQSDLGSALRALVEELDRRSAAPIRIEIAADTLRLPEEEALAVFRITQEALHNAIQHADASEIAVRLTEYPDRLRLTVTDDGQGITGGMEVAGGIDPGRFVEQGHFGLAGMRERAAMIGGKLDVQTAVDYGTVIVLELPR